MGPFLLTFFKTKKMNTFIAEKLKDALVKKYEQTL